MEARSVCCGSLLFSMATLGHGAVGPQGHASDEAQAPKSVDGCASKLTIEGFVLAPDGSPAEGAVVMSSAGGKALTDAAGSYRLEVDVPLEATSVQVTAVGRAERTWPRARRSR